MSAKSRHWMDVVDELQGRVNELEAALGALVATMDTYHPDTLTSATRAQLATAHLLLEGSRSVTGL